MIDIRSLFFLLVVTVVDIAGQELPDCNSDRPNSWATHRTLYVPENLLTDSVKDANWADALCCVYTHVQVIAAGGRPSLTTYDGRNYRIDADTFQELAEQTMHDICDMSMGSQDCNRRDRCVDGSLTDSLNQYLSCSSERPSGIRGRWSTYRTLEIPHQLYDPNSDDQTARIDSLCCVYTRIEIVNKDHPTLLLYDGSTQGVSGNTLVDIADSAMADICGMQMGSEDCNEQSVCVDDATTLVPVGGTNEDPDEDENENENENEGNSGGTAFPGCFPGEAMVNVLNKGAKTMMELQIGDKVLTRDGAYSEVYGFGHRDADTTETPYVELRTGETSLTLSNDHMVFKSTDEAVPAIGIHVGDEIQMADGTVATIESVRAVLAKGAYAPFTYSGDLVVDGIVASSYVAFHSTTGTTSLWGIDVTFHWMAHTFQSFRRLTCRLNMCPDETYNEDGIADWVALPFHFAQRVWSPEQAGFWRDLGVLVVLAIGIAIAFLEWSVSSPTGLTTLGLFCGAFWFAIHPSSKKTTA